MLLENNFTIDAPVERAWEALNSPETVAPCFPGATLTSYEGDGFAGTVKVKLGPIAMTYKGKGTYVSRDEAAHEVIIDATGRDSRGNGTASAKVTATLAADGPERTVVSLVTDMTITGKPAQFGRGVIADVADKIIGQFSACVARKLAESEEPAAAASPAAASAPASGTAAASNGAVSNGAGPSGVAGTAGTSGRAATAPASEAELAREVVGAVDDGAAALGTATDAPTRSAGTAAHDVEGSEAVVEAVDVGAAALGTTEADAPASTAMPSAAPAAGPATGGRAAAAATAPASPGGPAAAATVDDRPWNATPQAPVRSEVDAIDLLDTAGAPVLKRAAPAAGGGLLLVLVILLVRRLRSR